MITENPHHRPTRRLTSLIVGLCAAVLLVACGEPAAKRLAESGPMDGVWAFHSLNGEVGLGPLLFVSEQLVRLDGCGSVYGTTRTVGEVSSFKADETFTCAETDRLLQGRLRKLLEAQPQMSLTGVKGCTGPVVQIQAKDGVALFCQVQGEE